MNGHSFANKRLKQLKAEAGGTTKQVQGIYRALDERLWDSDAAYIKQAFNQEGLIQIKGVHKGWFKPSEVAWRSNSTFLDSLYPPLQSLYRDFSKFFVDKLGIYRELPTAKWVEALTRLGEVASPDERKAEALAIYRRANRDLGPKFGREVQAPDWVETFQTKAVYMNQRGEVVPNDEYLFANDAPAIAALFEDDEDLSFLAVPNLEVPRLYRLLDATEVSRLSDSITREVSTADSGVVDEDLTARVRRSVHFFARVLYAKRPEAFEQALDEGRFASLREFEVAEVPQVDMVVFIEVKGQSGAWTEEGVALTPTELMTAQQKGDRYWLCVVEYVQDDKRRQLHLLRNPYGLTQQFRFDVGWKSVAESVTAVPLKPEKDMYIDMPGVGRGQILSVRVKGRFFNLHVILEEGRQVNRPFNPAKMTLSKEPTWQE